MELTPIQEFYKGRSVLITGATGFCGKALLEKLLRSCPDIGNIFLLMRPKRGQDVTVRLAKLFDDPVFDTVKSQLNMPLEHKVFPIFGDITQMGLGISSQNRDRLCREVSIVFHAAATIKFNENLKVALQTNVMGTQEVVDLCKEMPLIVALIYVSTAYSQCPIPEIEEKVYHPPHDPKRLSECVNWLSETDFQSIEPTILGKWPNTYSYSKALAEHVIHENRDILPVAIFRPSIVISTWKDPIPGWIDNMNGPTMGIMGCSMGMIRCGHVDKEKVSDMVPVDTVVNALIAAAWETSLRRDADTRVYNFVSGVQQPIKWGEYFDICREYAIRNPPSRAIWYYFVVLCRRRSTFLSTSFFLEFIPACIMDIVPFLTTGKHKREYKTMPRYFTWLFWGTSWPFNIMGLTVSFLRKVDLYCKSIKFLQLVSHFSTQEWKFHDRNVRSLLNSLSPADRELFYFDLAELQWPEYLANYMAGIRYYLLKEKPSTLPTARKRYQMLYLLHCFSQLALILLFYKTIRRLHRALS